MKTPIKKSASNLFKTVISVSVFLLICFFAAGAEAQSINGPKPKKQIGNPPPKTSKPIITGTGRPGTGTGGRTRTGTGGRRTGTGGRSQTPAPTPAPAPPVVQPTPAPTPAPMPPTPAPPVQTPEQIMERFIDFQQSSSVTVKDWESVVAQTQSDSTDAQTKAQLFIAQGHLAYNRADYSSALVQFNAAAQVMPKSALPFYSIGKVYLITNQPNEAESAFERAIKLNKKFALAYQGVGDALTAQKKTKKAQDYYKDAARIGVAESGSPVNSSTGDKPDAVDIKNADPTTLSANSAYTVELKGARLLTTQKKWQSSLDKLLPLAKSSPTADAYIAIGDNYYGMEQWLSALQAYRKATELNSASASAYYKSGLVLFETNEFQSAAEAFEKSLILDQNGMTINRQKARKMADQASEKAKDMKDRGKVKKKNFLGM